MDLKLIKREFIELLNKNNVPNVSFEFFYLPSEVIKHDDGSEFTIDATLDININPSEFDGGIIPELLIKDYYAWSDKYYKEENLVIDLVDGENNIGLSDIPL